MSVNVLRLVRSAIQHQGNANRVSSRLLSAQSQATNKQQLQLTPSSSSSSSSSAKHQPQYYSPFLRRVQHQHHRLSPLSSASSSLSSLRSSAAINCHDTSSLRFFAHLKPIIRNVSWRGFLSFSSSSSQTAQNNSNNNSNNNEVTDKILMGGMSFHGYHGVFGAEKELGQKFLVDVEATVDLRPPGESDDLKKTLNYVSMYNDIKGIVEGKRYNLVEKVADQIARTLLANYQMMSVLVRVKKPQVAVPGVVNYLGVEIQRKPKDYTR